MLAYARRRRPQLPDYRVIVKEMRSHILGLIEKNPDLFRHIRKMTLILGNNPRVVFHVTELGIACYRHQVDNLTGPINANYLAWTTNLETTRGLATNSFQEAIVFILDRTYPYTEE